VSSGNEGDLRSEDYLSFFGKDPETKVILTYIEGLDDARRFFETAKAITPFKPIVAFKGGRTIAGARAAKSHSGSMAGARELYEAAFRQAGIVWASTTDEMLELAAAFSFFPLPRGNRVGILTRGGGWGVIAADACMEMGLEVPPLDDVLIRGLDKILPSYWSKGNPVDMVASMSMEDYLSCLEILISWEKVDAVVSLSGDAGPLSGILSDVKKKAEGFVPAENLKRISDEILAGRKKIYRRIYELIEIYKKPILAVGSNLAKGEKEVQPDFSLPQFRTPERAAMAAGRLYQYSRYRKAIGAF
jgi:acyl-CoA synthetase (NDP forming)